MKDNILFLDDFNDGIWTKCPDNPVVVRDQPWWEVDYICEPSIIYENGIFKMWYMGTPRDDAEGVQNGAAIGYATSPDGFAWTKFDKNPILSLENDSVIRPHVLKHKESYYLFAVDKNQWGGPPTKMRRWTSEDGIHWGNETIVLQGEEGWEDNRVCNPAVIVDDDGIWRMIYHNMGDPCGFGYAYSVDGINWTKHKGNPVITGFYGGDPFLLKIRNRYYLWYSRLYGDSLKICASWSADMIHWTPVYHNPQIGYTQPWERWVSPEDGGCSLPIWKVHLTDATLCEAKGKVYLCYQGVQTPLGMAVFDGTLAALAERMMNPTLAKWAETPYACVENRELKITENESDMDPVYENSVELNDTEGYALEYRARCYAGASCRAQVEMRYIDKNNFARLWIETNETTFYQECIDGMMTDPVNIGANNICDRNWHDWKIEVCGGNNVLVIDGRFIGGCKSSDVFVHRTDLKIGFSVFDTYASFDDVKVRKL